MFIDKRCPLFPPDRALPAPAPPPPPPPLPPTPFNPSTFYEPESLLVIRVALVDSVTRAALLASLRLEGDMREKRVDLSSSTVCEPNSGRLMALAVICYCCWLWSGARLLLPVKMPERLLLLLLFTCLGPS